MKYGKLFGIPALLAGVLTACAADYPSENELWKSFNNTPGSYIHVNRVFVNPGKESRKKLSAKDKAYKERNAARMSVRRRTLNRIWSDFSPGEKALILQEKYDLFHGKLYEAVIVTQRAMYLAMINEHPDKGEVFRKYELKPSASAHLFSRANAISAKDGNCELIDTYLISDSDELPQIESNTVELIPAVVLCEELPAEGKRIIFDLRDKLPDKSMSGLSCRGLRAPPTV